MDDPRFIQYRPVFLASLTLINIDYVNVCLYKRYRSAFVTYHSSIYDHELNCNSHVVSYIDNRDIAVVHYGKLIIFFSSRNQNYAFIQAYIYSQKKMSHYVELPNELHDRINLFFPMVSLGYDFIVVPITSIRHKCILTPISDTFCVSEIRIDYEHD